jgi:hypothetical protein
MNTASQRVTVLKRIRIPLAAIAAGFCLASSGALTQTLPIPKNLINFNSIEGENLLLESKARHAYFPLSMQFVTQKNQAYCGVASMVMVLNALNIPAPEAPEFGQYNVFTQDNIFTEKARTVITPEVVSRQGMTLEELGKFLASYPVKTQVYHGSDVSLDEFRAMAIKTLQEPGNFIIVNYLRKTIGQERGGHISRVAAYNQETDRFLILDVSRYKYPPVWVSAKELWQAMATLDSVSRKTRGFVLVSR